MVISTPSSDLLPIEAVSDDLTFDSVFEEYHIASCGPGLSDDEKAVFHELLSGRTPPASGIDRVRREKPEYRGWSDDEVLDDMYREIYSDMDRSTFDSLAREMLEDSEFQELVFAVALGALSREESKWASCVEGTLIRTQREVQLKN